MKHSSGRQRGMKMPSGISEKFRGLSPGNPLNFSGSLRGVNKMNDEAIRRSRCEDEVRGNLEIATLPAVARHEVIPLGQ